MLDPSIPLTVTEYDEWGNPNDVGTFEAMAAYGPYENVVEENHPALLVTAGLNDKSSILGTSQMGRQAPCTNQEHSYDATSHRN